jgi:glutathione peroxidase-family protein
MTGGSRSETFFHAQARFRGRPRRNLGRSGSLPSWSFGKYLLDKDGKVVRYFPSDVTPGSKDLRDAIEKALAN